MAVDCSGRRHGEHSEEYKKEVMKIFESQGKVVHAVQELQSYMHSNSITVIGKTKEKGAGLRSVMHSKKYKKNRAAVFVEWLIASVGKERLSAGHGVLDVAGGKGQITQKLVQAGIPSTLIDPRDCRDKKGGRGQSEQSNSQIMAAFDKALWEDGEHAHLLRGCSAVVAMHPDQATEPAIDYAISRGKILAVVPCCVFGRQSSNRLTVGQDDDDLVVTYEQYLEYLSRKQPLIKKSFLGSQGRDAVLHIFEEGFQQERQSLIIRSQTGPLLLAFPGGGFLE